MMEMWSSVKREVRELRGLLEGLVDARSAVDGGVVGDGNGVGGQDAEV